MQKSVVTRKQNDELMEILFEDSNKAILSNVLNVSKLHGIKDEDATVIAANILLSIRPLNEMLNALGNYNLYKQSQKEVFLEVLNDEIKKDLKLLYNELSQLVEDMEGSK